MVPGFDYDLVEHLTQQVFVHVFDFGSQELAVIIEKVRLEEGELLNFWGFYSPPAANVLKHLLNHKFLGPGSDGLFGKLPALVEFVSGLRLAPTSRLLLSGHEGGLWLGRAGLLRLLPLAAFSLQLDVPLHVKAGEISIFLNFGNVLLDYLVFFMQMGVNVLEDLAD